MKKDNFKKEEKNNKVEEKEYFLDYDLFNIDEIVKICAFFKLCEGIHKGKRYKKDEVITKYNEYRTILNNKALEKKYDKSLMEENGYSVYEVMKEVMNK